MGVCGGANFAERDAGCGAYAKRQPEREQRGGERRARFAGGTECWRHLSRNGDGDVERGVREFYERDWNYWQSRADGEFGGEVSLCGHSDALEPDSGNVAFVGWRLADSGWLVDFASGGVSKFRDDEHLSRRDVLSERGETDGEFGVECGKFQRVLEIGYDASFWNIGFEPVGGEWDVVHASV